MSCGVGCRRGSDPELLWLWRRPVATDLIGPLGLGTSIYHGSGPRNSKKDKTNKQTTTVASVTAAAWIQSLAWEFPYAMGMAIKRKKKKKLSLFI